MKTEKKTIIFAKLIGSNYTRIFFTFFTLLAICVSCSGKQTSTINTGENTTIKVEDNISSQNADSNNIITGVESNTASGNAIINTEDLIGLYYISSVDIIAMENVNQIYMVLANDDIIGSDKYFLEITHVEGNRFLIKNNLPIFFEDSSEFQYPRQYGRSFFEEMAEKGGGGTYLNLYFIEEGILLDYDRAYSSNPYEDEGIPNIIEQLKCKITFRKKLLEPTDSEISVSEELP